ncbi:hypothetical protein SULI_08590 [Saccharolobus solfataricus]|uniref:Uncharacterized protein n=3 Tax=Saccharolobus solfataricus TaxID=2287 RepID=Q7LXR7_SACS2|nr:hypothetical protein [Saccharolobus solfataricus]AAK40932.1 Hypothetical protein SSO0621 [Saccharolobus solfataricus P2]AKA73962.1 hypothetical protein SULB_1714 [Saccharolobus solfataricus]AKA76659.1 hypothetical protein SULC_1712 [Saccharolobus solfataricus]AKA79353.1 hypothetical protein SULA_1713 [Saccharolobus solfataricus]AZF68439.1 hypothetical protein SULG_08590 [Saccharolobus solfataricus]
MTLSDVILRYLLSEEPIIEINENDISAEEFSSIDEISIGLRIIIIGKNRRRRLVDLGLLQIIAKCGHLDFIRDYLNMKFTLRDIYTKYNVYTELEYLAIQEDCAGLVNDLDLKCVLLKVKSTTEKRGTTR